MLNVADQIPQLPQKLIGETISIEDVVITQRLLARRLRAPSPRREAAAMHSLANELRNGSPAILKQLAQLAVDLCDAGTGGISISETDESGNSVFRWRALAGKLEEYSGGSTPANWSPCGHCIAAGHPMLYSYPGRFFTYFQELSVPIVEGLVIPIYLDAEAIGTIWIVSHDERTQFDAEDVRVMTSLANFVATVLQFPATTRPREIVWDEYIRRIAQEDQESLTALSQESHPLVFSTALRIVGFREDAEEVAADVYTRVWKTAATYDSERGTPEAWLVSIARSRSIDRLRSLNARNRVEGLLAVDWSSEPNFESRRYLEQALQALPMEQKRAIELSYFTGLTASEIAEQLHEPLGSVKTRIRLGLIKLRRVLASVA